MKMNFDIKIALLFLCLFSEFVFSWSFGGSGSGGSKSKVLSRRKRYVTFPEGSSFSCAACMTVGLIGQPAPTTSPGTFVMALNWGIAYELPNQTDTLNLLYKKKALKKPLVQRRSRRDLYQKMEVILRSMGYNGRQCILKTLCETTQRLAPRGENMIEEMFRTLFTLPVSKIMPFEPIEHKIYDAAHRLGKIAYDCETYDCPLSLIDWVQGYYNAPSPKLEDIASKPWTMFSSNFV